MKLLTLLLIPLVIGCAGIRNEARRDVLKEADKQLDSLIEIQKQDCEEYATRLRTLKQKVNTDIIQTQSRPWYKFW